MKINNSITWRLEMKVRNITFKLVFIKICMRSGQIFITRNGMQSSPDVSA